MVADERAAERYQGKQKSARQRLHPMTGGVVNLWRDTIPILPDRERREGADGFWSGGLFGVWSPPFTVRPSQGVVARAADCIPL